MRSREHSYSNGFFQDIDGTKNKRNLTPIQTAEYIALIPFGAACMIEGVHQHLGIPRREVVKGLRD